MQQSKYFYAFTRTFSDQIGATTSFVWATYSGFWNLYESSKALGGLSQSPDWRLIEQHLCKGVPKDGGIDLKSISTKPWSYHEFQFATFILTQGAVLYEDWSASLAKNVIAPGKRVKAESFQFPAGPGGRTYDNWSAVESSGTVVVSAFLSNEIQPGMLALRASNIHHLDALLHWYRFFKEMRNCIAHHGGRASTALVGAYSHAVTIPLTTIGIKRTYSGPAPLAGSPLQIGPNDAVLMLPVISRIANALDAKFCNTEAAERDLRNRIAERLALTRMPHGKTLTERQKWFKTFLKTIGVSPGSWPPTFAWLSASGFL